MVHESFHGIPGPRARTKEPMSPNRIAAGVFRSIRTLLLPLLLAQTVPSAVLAQSTPPAASPPIRIIIEVPNDEAGRAFVTDKLVPKLGADARPVAAQAPAAPAGQAPPAAAAPASPTGDMMMPSMAAERLSGLRDRGEALVMAIPGVPEAIADAFGTFRSMGNRLHMPWLLALSRCSWPAGSWPAASPGGRRAGCSPASSRRLARPPATGCACSECASRSRSTS